MLGCENGTCAPCVFTSRRVHEIIERTVGIHAAQRRKQRKKGPAMYSIVAQDSTLLHSLPAIYTKWKRSTSQMMQRIKYYAHKIRRCWGESIMRRIRRSLSMSCLYPRRSCGFNLDLSLSVPFLSAILAIFAQVKTKEVRGIDPCDVDMPLHWSASPCAKRISWICSIHLCRFDSYK